MERHFEKELNNIRKKVEEMVGLCQNSMDAAMQAFVQDNPSAAERAFLNERRINQLEVEIDQDIAEFFALFQPVAVDLRFLLAILKINNDLERIGDHVVNISQSAVSCAFMSLPTRLEVPRMFDLARSMFTDACRSFLEKDLHTARIVLETDDMVDSLNRATIREAVQRVKANTLSLEAALELMRIARNLERIGDLSTNIAEEVIFHVQAKVIKHGDDQK